MRRFGRSLSGGVSTCSREFLFRRAIQQNNKFGPSSSSNVLRPQNSEEVVELSSMNDDKSIFLGFISAECSSHETDSTVNDDYSSAAYSEFKREDSSLDRAILECNKIRLRPSFNQGLLLKSVEPNPMFPFLHYAIFNPNPLNDRMSNTDDPILPNSRSLFGMYEELFAIQKSSTFIEPSTLPNHRHAGYIVSNFKILDRSRQQQLETNWLYWSGGKEIYRYTPRTWNLRKISLLRVRESSHTFAYVLLCEFGQILHPANFVSALEMCERLRGRICGNFNLYRVQYNYYGVEKPIPTTTATFKSPTISPDNHAMPNSMNRPPVPKIINPSVQRLAAPSRSTSRANIAKMGVSQEVDSINNANSRRAALYRMRDRSLGYETRFHSYHQMFEELT